MILEDSERPFASARGQKLPIISKVLGISFLNSDYSCDGDPVHIVFLQLGVCSINVITYENCNSFMVQYI